MPLWGTVDNAAGNAKPVYANTSNVFGVDRTEANVLAAKSVGPGWVQLTRGQGNIRAISVNTGGANINAAVVTATSGYLTLTGGTGPNQNTVANISFGRNNISNTVNSVTLNSGGMGYIQAPTLTIAGVTAADQPTFIITMGGRVGRNTYETLVFSKSITNDASDDGNFPDS